MDLLKTKFQIVVARYNEDIRWLLPYKDITIIYNKGNYDSLLHKFNIIYLNNIGRESHTYLYHIINNYDNLADRTIFFQGNISDHTEKVLDIEDYFKEQPFIGKLDKYNINKLKDNIVHFPKYRKELRKSNFTPYDWITKVIGIKISDTLSETNIVWNANFSLSKELIQSKPKIFYENILRYIDDCSNPEEGHFLERTWYLIFNSLYTEKKIIEYILINNLKIINDVYNKLKNNLNEVHLWVPLSINNDVGINHKIHFLKSINTFVSLNTIIHDNIFNIGIQSSNDISILIELENNIPNIDNKNTYIKTYRYEILLGIFNNTKSIIRDIEQNKIIQSYEYKVLDNDNLLNFNFNFNEHIIIKNEENVLFNIKNILIYCKIKSIKIKNNGKYNTYLSYQHTNNIFNQNNNIKIHLMNNSNENINEFYRNNYLDYYIQNINL